METALKIKFFSSVSLSLILLFLMHICSAKVITSCGGVIKDNSAIIQYKVLRRVLPNERCIWIIAPPRASSFEIDTNYKFHSDEHFLVIGAVNKSYPAMTTSIYPRPLNQITVKGNVLTVTFHTPRRPVNMMGFQMIVRVITSESEVNVASRYEFIPTPRSGISIFSHPSKGREYLNNELSMLVFHPQNNMYSSGQIRNLMYKKLGLQSACIDCGVVHLFNANKSRWDVSKNLCAQHDNIAISWADIILIVFRSDKSFTERGFLLIEASTESRCPDRKEL